MVKQIPALFLPKRGDDEQKTSVKQPQKKRMFNKKQEQKKANKIGYLLQT
jgi:hypothetical protein